MMYAKSLNQFLPFILVIVTTTLGIFFTIDDSFSENDFMYLQVSACNDNHIVPSALSRPGNFSGRYRSVMNIGDKGYVSESHHRIMGIDDDDLYIQATPLIKISFDSIVLNISNSYLLKLNIIRTIFIPPKA